MGQKSIWHHHRFYKLSHFIMFIIDRLLLRETQSKKKNQGITLYQFQRIYLLAWCRKKAFTIYKQARILAITDLLLFHKEALLSTTRYLYHWHLFDFVICIKETCLHPHPTLALQTVHQSVGHIRVCLCVLSRTLIRDTDN